MYDLLGNYLSFGENEGSQQQEADSHLGWASSGSRWADGVQYQEKGPTAPYKASVTPDNGDNPGKYAWSCHFHALCLYLIHGCFK